METKYLNNEKSLRIKELYSKSVKKCAEVAKEQRSVGIVICTLIPISAFLLFVDSPMAWLKGVTVVVLTLMLAFSFWYHIKVITRMSNAGDVDELLSINEATKKYKRFSYCVGLLLMGIAYGILHYNGSVNGVLMQAMPFGIAMAITWAISCFCETKDCPEIKEIKQLLSEE